MKFLISLLLVTCALTTWAQDTTPPANSDVPTAAEPATPSEPTSPATPAPVPRQMSQQEIEMRMGNRSLMLWAIGTVTVLFAAMLVAFATKKNKT